MQAVKSINDIHVDTLRRLNQDYIDSVIKRDVGRFEQLLADDFLNSNPDGSLASRSEFLARIAQLAVVSNFRCDDVRIRLMGDFAIVHGQTTYTKENGQPGAGRYTDIWALREGSWLCVAAHVTRG